MATSRLNLTRDQLATFLKDHELIKQFERLFATVDVIAPDLVNEIAISAGSAQATANDALALIESLENSLTADGAVTNAKATLALQELQALKSELQLKTLEPVEQYNNAIITDYLTINEYGRGENAVGRIIWDDGEGTIDVGLKGGNVVCKIGVQEYVRAYNETLLTMTKGQIVYISGAQGNRVAVKLAQADGDANSAHTIGIVAETIVAGGEGFVQVSGPIYKVDTLGTIAGDTVYLSPTIAGDWTTTKPVAPDHLVIIGFIERVHASVGSIFIKIDNGYELDELHNVKITSVQPDDLIQYDSAGPFWKNVAPSSVSVGSATNVTGIVAVANGGTGTSTAFTPGSVVFAGASGVYSQDNTNLFWDDTNKLLGIGTSTPQVALDVLGVGSFSALVYSPLIIGGTSPTSSLQLRSTLGAGTTGSDIVFQVGSNGATEVMRMLNNGNVGIGTTAPTEALDLFTGKLTGCASDLTNRVKLNLGGGGPGGGFAAADFEYPAGGKFRAIEVPVVTAGVNDIFFQAYPPTTGGYGYFETWAGAGTIIGTGNATPIIFRPNRAEVMRLTSAGNLGIGTTTPGVKLDVVGTIRSNTATYPNYQYNTANRIAFGETAVPAAETGSVVQFGSGSNTRNMVFAFSKTGVNTSFFGNDGTQMMLGSEGAAPITFRTGLVYAAANIIASGAERMRITSSGHVGIGAIPSAWVSSVRALQLGSGGSVSTWDGSNGSVTLGANLYDSGGSIIRYINSAPAAAFNADAGAFNWNTAPTGVAGNPITFSRLMTLTSAGSLGIGTASPAQVLDVVGGIRSTSGANNITLRHDGTNGGISNNGGGLLLYANGANAMILHTNSVERMRVSSTGNVGIDTGNPLTKLQVGTPFQSLNVFDQNAILVTHPTATSTSVLNDPKPVLYLTRTGTAGQAYGTGAVFGISRWENSGVASRARLDIQLSHGDWSVANSQTALNTVMTMRSDGTVGIGTGTPSANLEVNRGSEGEYLRVGGDNASNGRSLRFTSSTNDGSNGALHTLNAASASGAIAFATGGTERMRVTNTGTVGIGTTTNLSTLTVNGSFASKAPSTVNAATYTVAATDGSLRFTTTNCTVTLPAAASFPGRILYLNTITANSVTSAAANVIPLGSNTAGTAILAATAGKFAMIQSDGTNWITMMSN